jgi:hypothetical protein
MNGINGLPLDLPLTTISNHWIYHCKTCDLPFLINYHWLPWITIGFTIGFTINYHELPLDLPLDLALDLPLITINYYWIYH